MNAVEIKNLSKIYDGGKAAVKGIDLTLKRGEVFGFLGPNGAGKTTTVKLLNGILSPSEGDIQVFGIDPTVDALRLREISGVVTEHAGMYGHLTGLQNLLFYGEVFGLSKSECMNRALELLEKLGLMDAKDMKLEAYSTGMRQRLSLARALIHAPKILFLDEPTSGLDPENAQLVNGMIKQLAQEGCTIFLCTHQLRYAQEICTSYGLIDEGELLALGTLSELRAQISSYLTVRIKTDLFPKGYSAREAATQTYELEVPAEKDISKLVSDIVTSGGNVYQVQTREIGLEEIYFAMMERKKGGRRDGR